MRRLRATFGVAGAVACTLLIAACANVEAPVAPKVAAVHPVHAPAFAHAAQAPNFERRRLVEAFGGEYSAPRASQYLNGALSRLAKASPAAGEPYRVTILNSSAVNAFALPSGDIFVTRGLLALAGDGSEVAAVMAHEIAHVTARHAAQRAELEKTAALFKRVSVDVLDKPAQGGESDARMRLSIAKFSREQEFEADRIGIGVVAKAGYDPFAAARFLTALSRWSASGRGRGEAARADMLATHPSTPERVARAMEEARQFGAPGVAEGDRESYLAAIEGIAYGDDPSQGVVRGQIFIHPKLGFAISAPEGFALENQSTALIGVGAGGQEALRLDSLSGEDGTSVDKAVASGWIDGVKTGSVETLKIDELPAALAIAQSENWTFRLAAIRHGGRVFRLIYAAKSLSPAVDARFRASIATFHRITDSEAGDVRPAHVRVLEAHAGDTPEALLARSGSGEARLSEMLALNGVEHGASLTAGQRYKVVAP